MSDTYTQLKVTFMHPDITRKLESLRDQIQTGYARAAQSPDHTGGPWSPEKVAHVKAIGAAIKQIDAAFLSLIDADHRAMTRMKVSEQS